MQGEIINFSCPGESSQPPASKVGDLRKNSIQGENMKLEKLAGNVVLGLAILVAITGSAFAKNSGQLDLRKAVTVNGVPLAAGHYKVSWQTHSPQATVTFKRDKGSAASAEGKVEERPTQYDNNAVVYSSNPDGSFSIIEIRFAGSNKVLTFGEASPTSETDVPKTDSPSMAAVRQTKVSGSAPARRWATDPRLHQQVVPVDPVLLQLLQASRGFNGQTSGRQPIKQ
jgi:hypothetical protein